MLAFVPVPLAALDAVDPRDGGAVVDLYRRAFALRWRPFAISERSLAARWGIGNHRVRSILQSLADAGLIRREPPTGRRPGRVTVVRPTQSDDEQNAERKRPAPTDTSRRTAAAAAADQEEKKNQKSIRGHKPPPPKQEELPLSKRPRIVRSSRLTAAQEAAKAIWDEFHTEPYPWDARDPKRLAEWAAVATPEVLRSAIAQYHAAVARGSVWPKGEPPTTWGFTQDLARWVQRGRAAQRPAGREHGRVPPGTCDSDNLWLISGVTADQLEAWLEDPAEEWSGTERADAVRALQLLRG